MAAALLGFIDWTPVTALIGIGGIVLGIWILVKNPRAPLNQAALAMNLAVGIWLIGDSVAIQTPDRSMAMVFVVCSFVGAIFIPSTAFHLLALLAKALPSGRRWIPWVGHGIGVLLYPILMWEFFTLELHPAPYSAYVWEIPTHGLVYKTFAIFLLVAIYSALFLLWRHYFRVENRVEKSQTLIMMVGLTIAGVFGPIFSTILPIAGIQVNIHGGLFVAPMIAGIGWVVLNYDLFTVEAVFEGSRSVGTVRVTREQSHLVLSANPDLGYEMIRGLVDEVPGLCLTTRYPGKLRDTHDLKKTPILWLTDTESEERSLSPERLGFEILYTVESFMTENAETVVYLDDLAYLTMLNGFEDTWDFLQSVNNIAAVNSVTLIVSIDPALFEESELARLRGGFDEIHEPSLDVTRSSGAIKTPFSYLFLAADPGGAVAAIANLPGSKLAITNLYPEKFAKRYPVPDMDHIWLTTSKKGTTRRFDPRRLEFEGTAYAGEFLRGGGAILFLHGLEDLMSNNEDRDTLAFLKTLIDIAAVNQACVVAALDPKTLMPSQIAAITSRFDFRRS